MLNATAENEIVIQKRSCKISTLEFKYIHVCT